MKNTLLSNIAITCAFGLVAGMIYAMPPSKTEGSARACAILRVLSTAAETYASVNEGIYPGSIHDLTDTRPPYLSEPYCGNTISGYVITCSFSTSHYTFTASPASATTAEAPSYIMTTGGVLQ